MVNRRFFSTRAAATNGNGKPARNPARAGVATAIREEPFVAPAPVEKKRRFTMPAIRLPKVRLPNRRPRPEQVEIHLDRDDPFAYDACVACGATDWILRGRRSGDGTFPYWCLRCSRAFKTTVRIAHGRKPFVAVGAVVAVLVAFVYLLR